MSSPSSITFFIDRCLGSKRIVTALRQAGMTVEIHDDNFAPDAPDVDCTDRWKTRLGCSYKRRKH